MPRSPIRLQPANMPPAAPSPAFVVVPLEELRRIIGEEVRRVVESASPREPALDWINGDEAASMLGVARSYLRRVKGLPRFGSHRSPRYRRSDVEAFLIARSGSPLNSAAKSAS